MLEGWTLLPLTAAVSVVAAVLGGASRVGRGLALLIGTAALGIPLLAPEDSLIWRFMIAMYTGLLFMRVLELCKLGPRLSVGQRVWRILTYYDTRKATTGPRVFDGRSLAAAVAYGALLAAGLVTGGVLANEYDGPAHWALRWGGGVVAVYAFLDWGAALITWMHRAGGQHPPLMHDRPILATSVAEFWGSRWNLTVAAYFREHLLWPLARRRRALLGVVLSFVASAVLHWYIVLVSVGVLMSLYMAAFFLAQIILVLIERRARIRTWPRPLARVWTIGTLLVLSPLFVEPAFRIWDPFFASL